MPEIPSLIEMLKAGMHFGHQVSRWHPKMAPYIFGARNGIHIVNLELTAKKLAEALEFVKKTAARGGTVLFVGTKKQAQPIVERYARDCGMPYVKERWLGGTLTNFSQISRLINDYKNLKRAQEIGDLAAKYTKKEQLLFSKQIADMTRKVGGIATLEKMPDAIFLCDLKHEKTALAEASSRGVPIVAICDTNVNPKDVHYPIPSNDDAVKAIDLVVRLVSEAIKEGRAMREAQKRLEEVKKAETAPVAGSVVEAGAVSAYGNVK